MPSSLTTELVFLIMQRNTQSEGCVLRLCTIYLASNRQAALLCGSNKFAFHVILLSFPHFYCFSKFIIFRGPLLS